MADDVVILGVTGELSRDQFGPSVEAEAKSIPPKLVSAEKVLACAKAKNLDGLRTEIGRINTEHRDAARHHLGGKHTEHSATAPEFPEVKGPSISLDTVESLMPGPQQDVSASFWSRLEAFAQEAITQASLRVSADPYR